MAKRGRELTEKQENFVREYLVDMNASAAALRAGYSKYTSNKCGSRLLAEPLVRAAVDKAISDQSKRTEVTADYVITSLKTVADRCMQGEPVMVYDHEEKAMVPSGEWEFDSSGANRALELLGKHLQIFTEKLEVNHSGKIESITRTIVSAKK